MDRLGRVFYIDHKNRTTSWKKPEAGQSSAGTDDLVERNQEDQTGE